MDTEIKATVWLGTFGAPATVGSLYIRIEWISYSLLVIGVVQLVTAFVVLMVWMRDQLIRQAQAKIDSQDRTLLLAREARQMNDRQIEFVARARSFGRDLGLDGGTYLHGTDAPLWFVQEFLSYSHNRLLCPVRKWSEGTDERNWAQQITAVLIEFGFATVSSGPYASRWESGFTPDVIMEKLGLQPLPHPTAVSPEWEEVPA
jgi:hypothetical protein